MPYAIGFVGLTLLLRTVGARATSFLAMLLPFGALAFGAALYAYSLIEVATVSALRETAVVWAGLIGARFLGEGLGRRRIVAAIALAAGLVLLQFG